MSEPQRHISRHGWTYRIRPPVGEGEEEVVVLLHGLTGDESAMWPFAAAVPQGAWVVGPRAPHPAPSGGFSWLPPGPTHRPALHDFSEAVGGLELLLGDLERRHGLSSAGPVLVGFSQGAAVAFAAAAKGLPAAGVAALAGFLPQGDVSRLKGLPVYWGHGVQDRMVPLERAQRDVARLRRAGSRVTFCQAEVGHKVGAACMRDLQVWLPGVLSSAKRRRMRAAPSPPRQQPAVPPGEV